MSVRDRWCLFGEFMGYIGDNVLDVGSAPFGGVFGELGVHLSMVVGFCFGTGDVDEGVFPDGGKFV